MRPGLWRAKFRFAFVNDARNLPQTTKQVFVDRKITFPGGTLEDQLQLSIDESFSNMHMWYEWDISFLAKDKLLTETDGMVTANSSQGST